jgi:Xaa-Pro aminopeptidase
LVETLKIEPILGSSMISSLQRFYDEEELKLVKKAASIADAGFEAVRETLRPGVTELEVIGQMQYTFRKKGSEWDTFRVSGSGLNSAYSESLPSNRVINRGDMVFIDIGPAYKGYMADVSRTFMVGKPNSEQRIILDNLVEIESKAISLAKAGVKSGDLDTKIRQLVTDKGFGDFLHHSGHALSQAFKIVPESATVLEAGDVICLEPGIYVPGVGGGRIEDEIIITRGAPELISHANRCPYVEV